MSQPSPDLEYSKPPLTQLQRKALLGYAKLHTKPPTLIRLMLRAWFSQIVLLVTAVGVYVFFVTVGVPKNWTFLMLGLLAGAFFRDLGYFRIMLRVWPALDRVIDWNRVRELVGSPADEGAGPDTLVG